MNRTHCGFLKANRCIYTGMPGPRRGGQMRMLQRLFSFSEPKNVQTLKIVRVTYYSIHLAFCNVYVHLHIAKKWLDLIGTHLAG